MGLFSNKNKPCPICGNPTPRLLATKIEGEPLCSECGDAIMADDDLVKGWTLDEAKTHLDDRAKNHALIESFPATRTLDYGRELVVDDNGQQFYIKQWTVENPPVFSFSEIAGFTIELGWRTVESWSRGMQRTPYQPPQLGMLGTMAALAGSFSKDDDKRSDDKSESIKVTLRLTNAYLREYELYSDSVYGDSALDFEAKLGEEMARVNSVCNLIVSLTTGTSPAQAGPVSSAPSAEQVSDDILKYKSLLDAGVLTQEEFDAKKKQLLGV